jgi:flagellar M-ring protein FliF
MTSERPTSSGYAIGMLVAAVLALGIGVAPAHAAGSGVTLNAADAATVAFQDRLNSALQKMVDAVVGPGRAVVTTTAALDFDQIETTSTTYTRDPAAGALSESLSRTSYTDTTGATRYESTGAARVNALNVLRETRRAAPGRVTRLTVAVLVDVVAGKSVDLAQLRSLVSVAAGIDPRRGDALAVAAMPMNPRTTATAEATTGEPGTAPAAGRWLLAGAVLGMFAVTLLLAGWRRKRAQRDDSPPVRATVDGPRLPAAIAAPPQPHRDSLQRQRQISRNAGDDPQQAAAVLRAWTDR